MTDPKHSDGARLDFAGAMSYGDYLQLELVLGAQRPLSDNHNELLFIVQHQASELWLKLMIHELTAARDHVAASDLQPAFKMLARVARIMAQLNQSWDVLSTLTPAEYSAFRGSLGASSRSVKGVCRLVGCVFASTICRFMVTSLPLGGVQ